MISDQTVIAALSYFCFRDPAWFSVLFMGTPRFLWAAEMYVMQCRKCNQGRERERALGAPWCVNLGQIKTSSRGWIYVTGILERSGLGDFG